MRQANRDLDRRLTPFWCSATMWAEPLIFSTDGGDAGLIFVPEQVTSVTNAAAATVFRPGVDYVVDDAAGRIQRPPTSRMPTVPTTGLTAAEVHERTVTVTYRHRGIWDGYVPPAGDDQLPRVRDRLRQRRPLTLCVMGDSIAEGYEASAFLGIAPLQPPFAALVAAGLEQRHGSAVGLRNLAIAGWTSEQGRWQAADIAALVPDLVIVAFGMNDACYASAGEFAANVAAILDTITAAHPDAEFVLVSPMLPTPACTWVDHSRFTEYRQALASLCRPGIALADVTRLWSAVLRRKAARDLTANGSNHPNDFGHRLYAQTILATLGSLPAPPGR